MASIATDDTPAGTRPRGRAWGGDLHGEFIASWAQEVPQLMAQGATIPAIARSLLIDEATVKTHVSRIQTKLDARDRVQLVVIAHRAELT